jgi:hypothetical protein
VASSKLCRNSPGEENRDLTGKYDILFHPGDFGVIRAEKSWSYPGIPAVIPRAGEILDSGRWALE